jgi:hypothetical protein
MESQSNISRVGASSTGLYLEPSEFSDIQTEVLFGEMVTIESIDNSWARVTTTLDAYQGYVNVLDLIRDDYPATHRVSEVVVPVYSRSSFKWPMGGRPLNTNTGGRELYMNSLVRVTEEAETPEGRMAKMEYGWIFSDQIQPVEYKAPDFVAECMKFLGCSYEWAARSRSLVDCSAMIQAGCIAAGIPCQRDSRPQSRTLGESIDYAPDFSDLVRGDLAFWTEGKGCHVVVMVDSVHCLHASIVMPRRVVIQPLTDVVRDQARDGNGSITGVRRIPGYTVN